MKWDDIARKVLGKAMLDKGALSLMLRHAEPKDFPQRYRAVAVAMRNCALEGTPIDVAVLTDAYPELSETVMDLAIGEFTTADQSYWIQRLLECEQEERAKDAVGRMQDLLLKDQRPYGAKRTEMTRTFTEAVTVKDASRLIAISQPMETDNSFGPFVGFAPWDDIVNGLGEGRLHVLAGRPGRGKTTMAVQWSRMATCASVIVPLEMGHRDTAVLAARQGTLRDDCYVLTDPVTIWAQLRFDVAWAVQASGAKLVVFDHLGYLKLPAPKTQNRVSEIGDILRAIKQLMRELKASAVIVCQLNRAVEGRKLEKPELSDLRESGEIEQEADTVTFLWAKRGQEYEPEAKYCLTVSKNRHGSTGGKEIIFNRPERRFE